MHAHAVVNAIVKQIEQENSGVVIKTASRATNLGDGRVLDRFVRLDVAVAEQVALDHAQVLGQFFDGLAEQSRTRIGNDVVSVNY